MQHSGRHRERRFNNVSDVNSSLLHCTSMIERTSVCVCVHLQICVLLLRRAYTWCVCASVNAPRVGKYTVKYMFCPIHISLSVY